MNALGILALLVYTFGAYAYGAVLVLSLREFGARGWAGQPRPGRKVTEAELTGGAMLALGFVWFVTNVAIAMQDLGAGTGSSRLQLVSAFLAFLYPPIIMHVSYAEHMAVDSPQARRPTAGWRRALRLAYALIPAIPIWAALALVGVVPAEDWVVKVVISVGLSVSFIAASVYAVAMSASYGQPAATPRERLGNRAMRMMFGLMAVMFVLLLAVALSANARPGAVAARVVELAAKSLPLAFLFVGAYFESRYDFFDVLVKRGLSLLVTIGALWAFFSLRIIGYVSADAAMPWIAAVVLLPIVLVLPWVHGRISSSLDRRWLGRRFTVVDAVKHTVATLRSATTEPQLVELAERALGEIFGAPAAVQLGEDRAAPPFRVLQDVPIRGPHGSKGSILMGPRISEAPYFSEDVALLDSLADVFASVLDNLHLQERRREQEQLAQELSLHASRSELKALRAQINPHFLFNALNAIAGLIHRNPAGADRTIERLADVFRYALRGAESEWAVLDDELDFVRSYLEVERARFGDRLEVAFQVDDAARGARIPTMMIQTLVENAVKHGLAEQRGAAIVRVEARCERGRLTVCVVDNGPGFSERAVKAVLTQPWTGAPARPGAGLSKGPADGTSTPLKAGGYGLANIRQRLAGYFGDEAALTLGREGDLTVISVSMPLGTDR